MKDVTKLVGSLTFVLCLLALPTLSLFWVPDLSAQQTQVSARDPFAFEAVTVGATAVGLTAATVSPATSVGARQAFCTVEAASATAMRYRMDGVNPTAAVGHWVQAGVPGTSAPGVITLEGTNALLQFRAIRQAAVSVTLHCTYLR
ncbi:hypothetical protein BH24ACT15_BH24ACT15_36400 [soil metagenome]